MFSGLLAFSGLLSRWRNSVGSPLIHCRRRVRISLLLTTIYANVWGDYIGKKFIHLIVCLRVSMAIFSEIILTYFEVFSGLGNKPRSCKCYFSVDRTQFRHVEKSKPTSTELRQNWICGWQNNYACVKQKVGTDYTDQTTTNHRLYFNRKMQSRIKLRACSSNKPNSRLQLLPQRK